MFIAHTCGTMMYWEFKESWGDSSSRMEFDNQYGVWWSIWNWMTHMELDDQNGTCGTSVPLNKIIAMEEYME